jgi:hypothetical protein
MTGWWNDWIMNWLVNEMMTYGTTSWWNDWMIKCLLDVKTDQWKDQLVILQWLFDKMTVKWKTFNEMTGY